MFLRMLDKFLGGSFGKVGAVIGIIGGFKYFYDSSTEFYGENFSKIKRQQDIENVILTEEDRQNLKKYSMKKELTDQEMKEMKYELLRKREEQLINRKIKKYGNMFEKETFDNLEGRKKQSKD